MKNELPKYIFKKKYDKFYLLTEYDIVFNHDFTLKFNNFLKTIGYKELTIELDINQIVVPRNIVITNPIKLDEYYETDVSINETLVPLYMINFFIYDNSRLWEIYVSIEHELCIIGCNDNVNSILEIVVNPYEEESIEQKIKIIGDKFKDPNVKKEYINLLEKNYNFRW